MQPAFRAPRALALSALLFGAACADPLPTVVEPDAPQAFNVMAPCMGPVPRLDILLGCVTLDNVRVHQAAFQSFADANGGLRVASTPGHDFSAQYVAGLLSGAGYQVTMQPVQLTNVFIRLGPSALEQISPLPTTYVEDVDYNLFSYTEDGDVAAAVTAVDFNFDPAVSSTSGCEAADFAGFTPGHIALMQRGSCFFRVKAENAAAAGAVGAIIANSLPGLVSGTLTSDYAGGIPAVSTTSDRGFELYSTPGLVMRIMVDSKRGNFTTHNVIAESKTGDAGNVALFGAHLDSNDRGPGINDNGSGAAALLEVALQMANVRTPNRVRFAFWSGSEFGVAGSTGYLAGLTAAQQAAIALYIDAHMLGSPNFARFVMDGDGSTSGPAGPPGSGAIEDFFTSYYTQQGLPSEPMSLATFADHIVFANAGIPVGAIFAGSFGIKSPAQVALYGGVAGEAFDPCYHLACDTYANASLVALDQNSDALAAAVLTFGMNTQGVNGKKGRGAFKPKNVFSAPPSALLVR